MLTRRRLLKLSGPYTVLAMLPPGLARATSFLDADEPRQTVSPIMQQLSAYMGAANTRTLPGEVVERAKEHILDTFASMISGSGLPPGRAALEFGRSYGGKEIATVVASKIVCGPIEAAFVNQEIEASQQHLVTSIVERIEHPNLDVGMVPEAQDLVIAGDRITIVDEQAHAHSPVGGALKLLGEQKTGLVAPENVVLQVERALRVARHEDARHEAVNACIDDVEPGHSVVTPGLLQELLPQSSLLGLLQGERRRFRCACASGRRRAGSRAQGEA